MEILYLEKQKTHFILVVIYLIIALFLLLMAFNPLLFGKAELSLAVKILFILLAVFDLWLFWSFFRLTIKVTQAGLQIGFGFFKKKFNWSEIKNCSVEDYQKSRYLGYGIRFGSDKSIGYIAKGGRGVRLSISPRDYFFSTDNPERILILINQKIGRGNAIIS